MLNYFFFYCCPYFWISYGYEACLYRKMVWHIYGRFYEGVVQKFSFARTDGANIIKYFCQIWACLNSFYFYHSFYFYPCVKMSFIIISLAVLFSLQSFIYKVTDFSHFEIFFFSNLLNLFTSMSRSSKTLFPIILFYFRVSFSSSYFHSLIHLFHLILLKCDLKTSFIIIQNDIV